MVEGKPWLLLDNRATNPESFSCGKWSEPVLTAIVIAADLGRGRLGLRRTWIATDLDRHKEQQDHEAQIKPRSPHGAELHDPVKYCIGQIFAIDILLVIVPTLAGEAGGRRMQ